MNRQKRRRFSRLGCVLLALVALVALLPFAYLHYMFFKFSKYDKAMKEFDSAVVTNSDRQTVLFYELKQPNAQWNILYIHGTPGSASAFHEQFREPFPGANVFALDRPGFGESKPARRKPGLDDQANAIGAVLASAPPGRTILVGHSYGGPLALVAALRFTNQVAGVVLIGGSVDPAQEHVKFIQRIGQLPVISWLIPKALRQCNRELLTLRGDLVKLQKDLPKISVPVVMLHGEMDDLVPVENVDYLRAQFAAAGKTNLFGQLLFPGYNHFIPWEHPEAVAQAIGMVTNQLGRAARNK